MQTLYCNLLGGPSIGKSNQTTKIISKLKDLHIDSELIPEVAKPYIHHEYDMALNCQPFLEGTQLLHQLSLLGKMAIVIVDSPLLLNLAYPTFGSTPEWEKGVIEHHHLFNNLNILLQRNLTYPHSMVGRNHDLEESIEKDKVIKQILIDNNIDYIEIPVTNETAQQIVEIILTKITDV